MSSKWEDRAMFILMSLSHGSPNLQLGSAAFYLFKSVAILVPSGRFSCGSQVSYHIFVCFYFTTRTMTTRLAKLEHSEPYIARRPISMTLVPRPIKTWICHCC